VRVVRDNTAFSLFGSISREQLHSSERWFLLRNTFLSLFLARQSVSSIPPKTFG
jgi:hypothetical protein